MIALLNENAIREMSNSQIQAEMDGIQATRQYRSSIVEDRKDQNHAAEILGQVLPFDPTALAELEASLEILQRNFWLLEDVKDERQAIEAALSFEETARHDGSLIS